MTTRTTMQRAKKSTIAETLKTHQIAQQALPKPIRALSPEAQDFFNRIVSSREMATWNEYDLAAATMLAETEAQIVGAMQVLQTEGRVVDVGRGPTQHPEVKTISTLNGNARSLATQLGLSAAQRNLTNGSQALRSAAEAQARSAINNRDRFSLLA